MQFSTYFTDIGNKVNEDAQLYESCERFKKRLNESPADILKTMKGEKRTAWGDKMKDFWEGNKKIMKGVQEDMAKEEFVADEL